MIESPSTSHHIISPSNSQLSKSISTPLLLTSPKRNHHKHRYLRQQKTGFIRFSPTKRELEPSLQQQKSILEVVDNIDSRVDKVLFRNQGQIKYRNLRILETIKQLKRELELAQIRFNKLREHLENSPQLVHIQRESDFFKSFHEQLDSYQQNFQRDIEYNRLRIKNNQHACARLRKEFHAKSHDNLVLSAQIFRLRATIEAKKAQNRPNIHSKPRAPSLPKRMSVHSPIFAVNQAKKARLKSLEISTEQKTRDLLTEATSAGHDSTLKLLTDNYPYITSPNYSSRFIDESVSLRRELKELKSENQKARMKFSAQCSEFIELSSLYAECFSVAEKYLQKTQAISVNSGMQGSLLLALMNEMNKKSFSEFGPSKLTMENFFRNSTSKRRYARESRSEARDMVMNAFKKMEKRARNNNEERLESLIPQLTPELIREFSPMQLLGVLFVKQKIYKELKELLSKKSRAVSFVAAEAKPSEKALNSSSIV